MSKVVCFYQSLPELGKVRIRDNENMLLLWERSWTDAGWDTNILALEDALQHPLASKILDTSSKLYSNSKNSKEYLMLCYARWLSYDLHAEAWADFDVINYGLSPRKFYEAIGLTDGAKLLTQSGCAGAIEESSSKLSVMLSNFAHIADSDTVGIKAFDQVMDEHANEVSDMTINATLLKNSYLKNDIASSLISDYGPGTNWKISPLVHYHHGVGSERYAFVQENRNLTLQFGYPFGEDQNSYEIRHLPRLNDVALVNGTDKICGHFYTPRYEHHLKKYQHKRLIFLEIGVGGYSDPLKGGESIRMWSQWFTHPETVIIGIDICPKNIVINDNRVHLLQGSQIDKQFLENVIQTYGRPHIIVDDGSHLPGHVIETFEYLYPMLLDGGTYLIEDTQTSYWKDFENKSESRWATLNSDDPTHSYFKNLVQCINYSEIPSPSEPTSLDLSVVGLHFYHNLIIIDKDVNLEMSNCVPSRIHNRISIVQRLIDVSELQNMIGLSLRAHVGNVGDMFNEKSATIITFPDNQAQGNLIQGIQIGFPSHLPLDLLNYSVFIETKGWSEWVKPGHFAGTRGEGLPISGLAINMNEDYSDVFLISTAVLFLEKDKLVKGLNSVTFSDSSPVVGIDVEVSRL